MFSRVFSERIKFLFQQSAWLDEGKLVIFRVEPEFLDKLYACVFPPIFEIFFARTCCKIYTLPDVKIRLFSAPDKKCELAFLNCSRDINADEENEEAHGNLRIWSTTVGHLRLIEFPILDFGRYWDFMAE